MIIWTCLWLVLSSAKLKVNSPSSLVSEIAVLYSSDEVPSSLANFGNPPYGTMMRGKVFSPAPEEATACSALTPVDFGTDPGEVPVLLVWRGDCYFATKVRNAQHIGAAAVLIGDDKVEDVSRVIMIESSQTEDISIPSMLIPKTATETLMKFTTASSQPIVTLYFEMRKTENTVVSMFWSSSENEASRQFLQEFAEYAQEFTEDALLFMPHFVTWPDPTSRANDFTEPHPDCLSNGRYCVPESDSFSPQTGRDIVVEDLRQLCAYTEARKLGAQYLWWQYIQRLISECTFGDKSCSDATLQSVGIDPQTVDTCFSQSFSGVDIAVDDNHILADEQTLLLESGVFFYPTLFINNQRYRGDLEGRSVFKSICAGFEVPPSACQGRL